MTAFFRAHKAQFIELADKVAGEKELVRVGKYTVDVAPRSGAGPLSGITFSTWTRSAGSLLLNSFAVEGSKPLFSRRRTKSFHQLIII